MEDHEDDEDSMDEYEAPTAEDFCRWQQQEELDDDEEDEDEDEHDNSWDAMEERPEDNDVLEMVQSLKKKDRALWLNSNQVADEQKEKFYHFTQTQPDFDDDEEEESDDEDDTEEDQRTLSELDESTHQRHNFKPAAKDTSSTNDDEKKPAAVASVSSSAPKKANSEASAAQNTSYYEEFGYDSFEDDDFAALDKAEEAATGKKDSQIMPQNRALLVKPRQLENQDNLPTENIDPKEEEDRKPAAKRKNDMSSFYLSSSSSPTPTKKKIRKSSLRRKDENQQTLTQCIRDHEERVRYDAAQCNSEKENSPEAPLQEQDQRSNNDPNVRWKDLGPDRGLVPMRVGDIWTSAHPKRQGMYYKIVSFMPGNSTGTLNEEAVCEAYIDMEYTFIGSSVFDGTLAKYPSENYQADIHRKPISRRIFEGGMMPLKFLNGRRIAKIAEAHWIYEFTGEKINKNFHFAYRFEKPSRIRRKDDSEVDFTIGELCSGVGGMGLGFKNAGGTIKYAVDNNQFACMTLAANFPLVEVINQTISKLTEGLKEGKHKKVREGTSHIHMSSPCKGFSGINTSGGKDDEKNNNVSLEVLGVMDEVEEIPTTFSFENVLGMLRRKHRHYPQQLVVGLMKQNYQVRGMILDASDYGDPQQRERFVLFGAQLGFILPERPEPLPLNERGNLDKALGDLRDVLPQKDNGTILIDGKDVYDHLDDCTELREKESNEVRHLSQLAGPFVKTVLCGHPIKHDTNPRYLTIREYARLMSFPDWFRFWGSHTAKRTQIGNAVPIGLATAIAKAIKEAHMYEYESY
jgi:DNA (cytosine-5)-methyltransferase 1